MGIGRVEKSRDAGTAAGTIRYKVTMVVCFSSNDEGREILCPPDRSVLLVEYKEVKGNVTLFSLDSRLTGSIIPERH